MKKLALGLLLAAFVGSAAFAIDGIGDFNASVEVGISNINNAKGHEAGSKITIEPYISYSRSFGILGLEAGIGDVVGIATGDFGDANPDGKIADELYVKIVPSVSLDAGPGTLGFSITLKPVFYLAEYNGDDTADPTFVINPVLNYTLDIGIASLGFEVGTDELYIGDGQNEAGDGYGLAIDAAYLKVIFDMPLGLSIWASPRLHIALNDGQGDTELSEIRADVSFQALEMLSVGVEGRFRVGAEDKNDGANSMKVSGIMVRPHVDIGLGDIAIWVAAEIDGIGNDVKFGDDNKGIAIKPVIGASFAF